MDIELEAEFPEGFILKRPVRTVEVLFYRDVLAYVDPTIDANAPITLEIRKAFLASGRDDILVEAVGNAIGVAMTGGLSHATSGASWKRDKGEAGEERLKHNDEGINFRMDLVMKTKSQQPPVPKQGEADLPDYTLECSLGPLVPGEERQLIVKVQNYGNKSRSRRD